MDAIVTTDDLGRMRQFDAEREPNLVALSAVGEAFKDVPVEELDREVREALAEVREENREKPR